jgi:predicted small lipoprotein YifL
LKHRIRPETAALFSARCFGLPGAKVENFRYKRRTNLRSGADSSMNGSRIFAAIALILAAAVVTGCGRKSGLDTPYQAQVDARKEAEKTGGPMPPEPQKPDNDKPFLLDPLL